MKNKIEDLRDHLFATIEDLRDEEKPMDLDRAKAIAEVGQVIIDSAKAENEFIKLTGSKGSGFIPRPALPEGQPPLVTPPRPQLISGSSSRTDRASSHYCPDPNCGGRLSPETDGNGGVKDVCDKCRRSVVAA